MRHSVGAVLLALAACTGTVGGLAPDSATTAPGSGRPGASGAGGAPGAAACASRTALAPARLWRLSDDQYVAAVRDLFGVELSGGVTAAALDGAAVNQADLAFVNASSAASYQAVASEAARRIAAPDVLTRILPCRSASPDEACVRRFITETVARAYRRRLSNDEVNDLVGLFRAGSDPNPAAGVELLVEAVLQSPLFLWRTELGSAPAPRPGTTIELSATELAGALAFFFLGSVPDGELWDSALRGDLTQPRVLAAQVQRLLGLPRVQAELTRYAERWLGLPRLQRATKDPNSFPSFDADAHAALVRSGSAFLDEVLWRGRASDLLASRRLHLDRQLAALYGVPGVASEALSPVDASEAHRASGVLSHPAFIAAHSGARKNSVVHRGLFLYETLLCGERVPPPPAALTEEINATPEGASEREAAGVRAASPRCSGCHAAFDPLGLLSEHYDAIGVYRATDGSGAPIDARARVGGLGAGLDGEYDDVGAFARQLLGTPAGLRRLTDCALGAFASALLGRDAQGEAACRLREAADRFASAGSFPALFEALATAPGFRQREVQ